MSNFDNGLAGTLVASSPWKIMVAVYVTVHVALEEMSVAGCSANINDDGVLSWIFEGREERSRLRVTPFYRHDQIGRASCR